jgi:hypothetical protein
MVVSLLVCALCMLVTISGMIILGTNAFNSVNGNYVSMWMMWFGLELSSIAQITTIRLPQMKTRHSASYDMSTHRNVNDTEKTVPTQESGIHTPVASVDTTSNSNPDYSDSSSSQAPIPKEKEIEEVKQENVIST